MSFEQELGRALIRADQRDFKVMQTLCQQRAELLEALKDLVYQVNRPNAPAWLSLDDAFAAITKAEAEE